MWLNEKQKKENVGVQKQSEKHGPFSLQKFGNKKGGSVECEGVE